MTILVILSAIIVPRFGAARRSETMLAGDQIEDLLRMWAYRSSIGTQQVGIWHDSQTGYIKLMVRDYLEGADPEAGDVPQWDVDRLSNAVRLPESVEILEVVRDYETLDPAEWFVYTNPDRTRPQLAITLRGTNEKIVTVSLEPYSNAPIRTDSDNPTPIRMPIDLDAEGEERVAW